MVCERVTERVRFSVLYFLFLVVNVSIFESHYHIRVTLIYFLVVWVPCGCLSPHRRLAGGVVAAMATGNFKSLTTKHGVRICVSFPCSVESIGLAVGEKVGHSSVVLAARMNSAVVVFLDRVEKVNSVVETGITVDSCYIQVLPLSQPATRVVLSNVPPFITGRTRCGQPNRTILKEAKGSKVQMNRDVSESECVSESSEVLLFNNSQRKNLLQ